ncbi:maleylpyruvate isomerase family mycothiol-dependent enzyme [Nocardiopsis sediminis]|uniref:Maleylpyruvate isomerase family mycothiol-dependent enzyme n=1 Tax=Nocardiopsis sediminis TaxID=1778267 RepID=A0ABV8FNR1_9ACTN
MDHLGPAIDTRPLFPVERAALLDLLDSLGPADWAAPTVCPGWAVRDLVAHLLNDHIRRLSGSRDSHAGAVFADDETLRAYLDSTNGEFVRAAQCASPRVMADLIGFLGPQLDALWATRDLHAPADLGVSWAQAADSDPTPAWLDIARDYTEFWTHQQQIRDAVGRPGADTPDLAGPVLDTFMRALPRALRGEDRPAGTAVVVELTGPAGGAWAAVRGEGRWALRTGAETPSAPAAYIAMDQDTFWRLATRGIAVKRARSLAETRGDPALIRAATAILSIVG